MNRCVLVVSLCLLVPRVAVGQEAAGSEYAREALRLKLGFWGSSIVRGSNEEKVGGLGLFGHDVEVLSARDDEISVEFRSYRSKKKTSGILIMTGIAALAASLATIDPDGDNTTSGILFGGFFGALLGGAIFDASAHESLSRAIWMYNGTLVTAAP